MPVGEFAELSVALVLAHGELEPGARGPVVLLVEDGEDLLDLAAEFGETGQDGCVLVLDAGECVELGGELFDFAAQGVDVNGEGRDGGVASRPCG